jgi:hypothetical protein
MQGDCKLSKKCWKFHCSLNKAFSELTENEITLLHRFANVLELVLGPEGGLGQLVQIRPPLVPLIQLTDSGVRSVVHHEPIRRNLLQLQSPNIFF